MSTEHKLWLDRMVALEQNLDEIQNQIEQMSITDSWMLEDSQQIMQAIQAIRRQWLRGTANREALQKLRTFVPLHLLSKPTTFRAHINTIEHWMNELEEGENA
jgi:site-specific recombinase XerC